MLNKKIKFNLEARESILKGINILSNSVKVTLGPQGNCVILGEVDKQLRITKDGVSIAKEIKLNDPFENVGAQLIREAAIKTLSSVGDATTTSTVLAQSLINLSMKQIRKGKNSIKIKKGIEIGTNLAVNYIKDKTIKIKDSDIKNIATISSNNDSEIGKLIGEAYNKIGRDGIITIENSTNSSTSINVISGMQFDRGYISQHFVTDFIKDVCTLDNPYILITEYKINRMKDIAPILNEVVGEGRSILIMAEDFDSEVLETLKLNKLDGRLKVCLIKAPSFGEYRHEVLNDIAILTGGTNVSYDSGIDLIDVTTSLLGKCSKVIVNKQTTTIIGGKGDQKTLNDRVLQLKEQLKQQIKSADQSDFITKFLKERIAKLVGGIAVIYVGGTTELEMGERKDRIEDAVYATKAAIEEGVVLGGGLTYYNASNFLKLCKNDDKEIELGIRIVEKALLEPFNTIVKNAGYNPKKLYNRLSETIGFDANTEKFVNMYNEGIIDPAKAARLALENSSSVTQSFISTECVIVPEIVNQLVI